MSDVPTLRGKEYRVCSNCVMDTSDSKIRFDEFGVCDHCRTFYQRTLPNWHTGDRGQQELSELLERVKEAGRGREFDAIVGLSGGIDSSYLTYLCKREFGLNPLVFHVDAGWNSELAVHNIQQLIEGLDLDLYTEVIDWEEMRDLQLAFFRSGVPHIDTPQDHAFFATMYKFAEEHGVPFILTGANLATESINNPTEWMYYQSDSTQILDIHQRFGQRPLRTFPLTSILRHKVYLRYVKGIRVVRPLDYIPYDKEKAIKLLVEEFGWQPYPQKHFESRFTRFYEGFWLPSRFGFDTRRVQFSSLILSRQMTRAEALEELRRFPYDPATIHHDFEFIAKKLGISTDELWKYHQAPKRTHRDYKSQHLLYTLGAKVTSALGMELGVKR